MRSRIMGFKLLVIALVLAVAAGNCFACMSFKVTAKDGNVMAGRTMEFAVDLDWNLAIVPRGLKFASPAPDNVKGNAMSWSGKLGFIGVNLKSSPDSFLDGMNEKGLSVSFLWFEPDTRYSTVTQKDVEKSIAINYLGSWILSNFSTSAEVKDALKNVKVFGVIVPGLGFVPPLHMIVHDATGASIVVEFKNGDMQVFDNPLGIMTNSPSFDWHMANLRNYVNLSNIQEFPNENSIINLPPMGHGVGMIGLPGDMTPPARFVRLAFFTKAAIPAENKDDNLNLAQHIANVFDIARGYIVDKHPDGKITCEKTQWVCIKDLTNRVCYFRTYDNMELNMLDLGSIDFSGNKVINVDYFAKSIKPVKDLLK